MPRVEDAPTRPTGPTRIRLPDGSERVFRFVKVACNVAHPTDVTSARGNTAVSALLRDCFGPKAALPRTAFEVEFTSDGTNWHAAPVGTTGFYLSNPPPPTTADITFPHDLLRPPRPATRVPAVYDLTAAASFWGPDSLPEEFDWMEVPGVAVKPGMFVARVTCTSMEPLIPDGLWPVPPVPARLA